MEKMENAFSKSNFFSMLWQSLGWFFCSLCCVGWVGGAKLFTRGLKVFLYKGVGFLSFVLCVYGFVEFNHGCL